MSGAELDRSRQLDVLDLDKGATISERAYYAYNLTTVVSNILYELTNYEQFENLIFYFVSWSI